MSRYMTDDEICMFYRQAANPDEEITVLAQLNGVESEEIERVLVGNGYDVKIRKKVYRRRAAYERCHLSQEDYKTAAQMRSEGHRYKEIAEALDCSVGTISNILRRMKERERKK